MSDNYVGRAPNSINVLGDYSPIGAINWFHAPPDASWLQLNGQTISKATYADLWVWAQSFITTDQTANPGLYLSVDANNFKVPNFSGMFVRSTGQVDGSHVASALGVKQRDDVGPLLNAPGQSHYWVREPNGPYGVSTSGDFNDNIVGPGAETRPVNVSLVPCVKALKAVLTQGTQIQSDWKLIDFKDAASSATLDFTTGITSEYDAIYFVIRGITPATADQALVMRFSTDGGATFNSLATDHYEALNILQSNANNPVTRTNNWILASQACGNTITDHGVNGHIEMYAPSLVGKAKHLTIHTGHWRGGTSFICFTSSAMFYANGGATPAVNGVRFFFQSGNIAAGRILMYGMRNTVSSPLLPSYATAALQADQEAATSTDKYVTPGLQKNHPSAAKAWVNFNGSTGAIRVSYNVTSITKNAAGDYTVNFTTPFSSADYCAQVMASRTTGNPALVTTWRIDGVNVPTAFAFRFQVGVPDSSRNLQAEDAVYVMAEFKGDQ